MSVNVKHLVQEKDAQTSSRTATWSSKRDFANSSTISCPVAPRAPSQKREHLTKRFRRLRADLLYTSLSPLFDFTDSFLPLLLIEVFFISVYRM